MWYFEIRFDNLKEPRQIGFTVQSEKALQRSTLYQTAFAVLPIFYSNVVKYYLAY